MKQLDSIKRYMRFVKPYRWLLILTIFIGILKFAIPLLLPWIVQIILDNILPGDIYLKARELHFNNEANRVVLLIRLISKNDISVCDIISNLFPDKNKDFVIKAIEHYCRYLERQRGRDR